LRARPLGRGDAGAETLVAWSGEARLMARGDEADAVALAAEATGRPPGLPLRPGGGEAGGAVSAGAAAGESAAGAAARPRDDEEDDGAAARLKADDDDGDDDGAAPEGALGGMPVGSAPAGGAVERFAARKARRPALPAAADDGRCAPGLRTEAVGPVALLVAGRGALPGLADGARIALARAPTSDPVSAASDRSTESSPPEAPL